jgi:hypothetical protein
MTPPTGPYADWKAPADDGQLVIWPAPDDLARQTRDNQGLLSGAWHVRLQNAPLPDLRREARRLIGHDDAVPLIATGHQTELHHPGVWSKNVLIDALARRLGGAAVHFAIDTDQPKHLHLRWAGASHPITCDPALAQAPWSGLLRSPSPAHVGELVAALARAQAAWGFVPLAGELLAAMRRLATTTPRLSPLLAAAHERIDRRIGLDYRAIVGSALWLSRPFLVLVHHILARAGEFAACYNDALRAYRLLHGIKTHARPWPDLRAGDDRCEAPFWLDDQRQAARDRSTVHRDGGRWALRCGDEQFIFDPQRDAWDAADALSTFLNASGCVLAPRALTLTLFLRLVLVDQFVHGIGGGRYDQVTDLVVQRWLGLQAPRFSVTTATLYFPHAVGRSRINLRPLLQEGRRIRHACFSDWKMQLVRRIEALPRRSAQRRDLFFQMHARLDESLRDPAFLDWQRRLDDTRQLAAQQSPLFDRELSYCLQPADRLLGLIAKYNAACSLTSDL